MVAFTALLYSLLVTHVTAAFTVTEPIIDLANVADPAARAALSTVLTALSELQIEQRRTRTELDVLKAGEGRSTGQEKETVRRRRLKEEPTVGDDDDGLVHIIQRTMTTSDFVGPNNGFGGATVEPGGGKYRRTQGNFCGAADLSARLSALETICCDEPSEDCSSGFPTSCNEGCAAAMGTFWADCQTAFTATSTTDVEANMQTAVNLCAASTSDNQALSLAELFNLSCNDAQTPANCVPDCEAVTHGYVLLATIDGDDSSFNCHLTDGLYSWVGDGTYLGGNVFEFLSSVVAGVGGAYFLHVEENNAAVSVDVRINPGQVVRIAGDAGVAADGGPAMPIWGGGSFLVANGAELSLTNLLLKEGTTVLFGGNGSTISLSSMALPSSVLSSLIHSIATTSGTLLKLSNVDGRSGTIEPDGRGGWTCVGISNLFAVISDVTTAAQFVNGQQTSLTHTHCTTSQGGRCVGRRYSDEVPWPSDSLTHNREAEICQIVVLGAGSLANAPFFDTVSYDASTSAARTAFSGRRDVLGIGGANCWGCVQGSGRGAGGGNGVGHGGSGGGNGRGGGGGFGPGYGGCSVYSSGGQPVEGCYSGVSSLLIGTQLAAGETLTWRASGDHRQAYVPDQYDSAWASSGGSTQNQASAHEGWELCFA